MEAYKQLRVLADERTGKITLSYTEFIRIIDDVIQECKQAEKGLKECAFLKEALRMFIKINDDDLSHLKIKVISQNVAVNQGIIKLLKEVLENE